MGSATDICAAIGTSLPSELVDVLVTAYSRIESSYAYRKWEMSELDAGHFAEAARRVTDYRLFGKYAPIGKTRSCECKSGRPIRI